MGTTIKISTELGALSRPVHVPKSTRIGDSIMITNFYCREGIAYTVTRDPFECGEGPHRLMVVGQTEAGTEKWFYATL